MNLTSLLRSTLAALAVFAIGCGPELENEMLEPKTEEVGRTVEEIVGGTDTTIATNPWQVSLQSSGGSHFCGGSIINSSWILTAQHCVNSGGSISAPGRVVAGITRVSQSSTGQIRTVAQVYVYPGYVDASKGKDAALLRLSSPLDLSGTNAKSIGLVTAADASAGVTNPGVVSRITGWGTTSSGGSLSDNLKTADVNIISNSSAQSSYPQETITADQLAAAAPGKDTCQGDSGGPLTVLKSGVRVLAGITSWGYGCADPNYPGMYGRVSSFESWINSTINAPPPTVLLNQTNLSSSTVGAWRHFPITVPSGKTSLNVNMSGGTGDADLYVKSGTQPTTTSYNCRPYKAGNNESCTLPNPVSGTWYVSIRTYSAYSGVSVTASVQ